MQAVSALLGNPPDATLGSVQFTLLHQSKSYPVNAIFPLVLASCYVDELPVVFRKRWEVPRYRIVNERIPRGD